MGLGGGKTVHLGDDLRDNNIASGGVQRESSSPTERVSFVDKLADSRNLPVGS